MTKHERGTLTKVVEAFKHHQAEATTAIQKLGPHQVTPPRDVLSGMVKAYDSSICILASALDELSEEGAAP